MTEQLILSALVDNHSGVLQRVAGLFSRRGFNITSLTVCETEDHNYSRMTIVSQAEPETFRQIEKQLLKLEDVRKVVRLDSDNAISSELVLVKVSALNKDRPAVLDVVARFGARVKDIGHTTMTLELTGLSYRLDKFISRVEPFGILEMARTGFTALERGDVCIKDESM
ncbi:MAG: acetolactate synthase small subunit [Clostridiales bacterium]|nr:acetolactate synthase small subunit [Clostridiales bacterium]